MNDSTSLLWSRIALWFATGWGFGYAPKAPGTVGALWGIPLAMLVSQLPHVLLQLLVLLALFLVGIPMCSSAARSLGKKDPGSVVWDEIVTVPLAFLFVDPRLVWRPEVLLIGFVLHRIFDISKLWPVKEMEKLPTGTGIMADDLVAGVYACASMHLLLWLVPWLSRV